AAQEDPVAAVDGGAVAPARAGEVERAGLGVEHLAAAELDALAPPTEARIKQRLQAALSLVGRLARAQRHLRLHERVAGGCQRLVGRAEALHPTGLVEVPHDEGVTPPPPQADVE